VVVVVVVVVVLYCFVLFVFSWELIIIEIQIQKVPTRISITQVLYIDIAGQEVRLSLLSGEVGKNAMFLNNRWQHLK